MKLLAVTRRSIHALLFLFVPAIAVACSVGCGGSNNSGNAFVGTWSCPTLPAGLRTLAISVNADDSLTLTGDSDAGSALCASDEWTYSGSTASMLSGTSCLGGSTGTQVLTIASFSLAVNGKTLTVNAKETVSSPGATPAHPTVLAVTLSGTCNKS